MEETPAEQSLDRRLARVEREMELLHLELDRLTEILNAMRLRQAALAAREAVAPTPSFPTGSK